MTTDVKLRLGVSGAAEVSSQLGGVERQLERTTDAVRKVGHYGIGLAVVVPALQGMLSGAIAMADAAATLTNRLQLSTKSAQSAAIAFDGLYKAAQSSRTSFVELGSVYATMARAGHANMTVVKAIGDAMAISGGSAAGMNAALVQLGQGMSAGVLRGEELNSVMEQAPRLAQALADGLGVPIGALRKLGEEGKLTSERVVEALTKAAPQLAEEVSKSTMTVSQGMTVVSNATTRLVGDLDKAVGGSAALAAALKGLSAALDGIGGFVRSNSGALSALMTAIAGAAAVAGLAAVASGLAKVNLALKAIVLTMSAHPVLLAVLGITAAAGAAYGLWADRARELETYSGKLKRLGEIETQLERNRLQGFGERSIYGGDGENVGLRRERDELRRDIEALGNTRARDELRNADRAIDDRAQQEQAAALKDLAQLRAQLSGIDAQYGEQVLKLAQHLQAGRLTQAEYNAEVAKAYAASKSGKAAAQDHAQAAQQLQRAREQALRAEQAATADRVEAVERLERARADEAQTLEQQTEALRQQFIGMTAGKRVVEEMAVLRLEDAAAQHEQIAAGLAMHNGSQREIDHYRRMAELLRQQIALRKGIAAAAEKELAEDDSAAKEFAARWQRINDQIGQSLSDALMAGGKNAAEYIKGLFRSLVLRPVIEAAVRPIAGMITGMFGFSGPAGASGSAAGGGAGGGAGSLMQLGSLGASLAGMSSLFSAGTAATMAGNFGGAMTAAGNLIAGGQVGTGLSFGAGAAGPYVAAAILSTALGRAIGGGYSVFGGSGNTLNNLAGPIGGLINRAFGRKNPVTTGSGVLGTAGLSGFSGQAYRDWHAEGGWLRSDKSGRDLSAVDAEIQALIDTQIGAVYQATQGYAEALGLPAEAARNYSRAFTVAWGDSQEANEKALADAIAALGNDLAGLYAEPLLQLKRASETMAEALARLGTLQAFSTSLNDLGGVFSKVASLSVDAREQMIGFAGGMENFALLARGFVSNYYSRDEIAGLKAREIQQVLAGVGLDAAGLSSRDQFRTLVEGLDVGTEAGRRQLAAALGVQGSFADVADFLAETGGTLGQASAAAPEFSALGSLFSASAADQVAATNQVRDSVDTVADAVNRLIAVVQASAGQGAPTIIVRGSGTDVEVQLAEP